MYMERHSAKEQPDPELTLKPNMDKTLMNKKTKKYYHNGKWELCKVDEKESWSCCMNADKNSEGCVAVVVDKEKWILSSYA